jgi:hypothetical protein
MKYLKTLKICWLNKLGLDMTNSNYSYFLAPPVVIIVPSTFMKLWTYVSSFHYAIV